MAICIQILKSTFNIEEDIKTINLFVLYTAGVGNQGDGNIIGWSTKINESLSNTDLNRSLCSSTVSKYILSGETLVMEDNEKCKRLKEELSALGSRKEVGRVFFKELPENQITYRNSDFEKNFQAQFEEDISKIVDKSQLNVPKFRKKFFISVIKKVIEKEFEMEMTIQGKTLILPTKRYEDVEMEVKKYRLPTHLEVNWNMLGLYLKNIKDTSNPTFQALLQNFYRDFLQHRHECETMSLKNKISYDQYKALHNLAGSELSSRQGIRKIQFKLFYTLLYFTGVNILKLRYITHKNITELMENLQTELIYKNSNDVEKNITIHIKDEGRVELHTFEKNINLFFIDNKFIYLGGINFCDKEKVAKLTDIARNLNQDLSQTIERNPKLFGGLKVTTRDFANA